jgi:TrmH family RNA methyltransferase
VKKSGKTDAILREADATGPDDMLFRVRVVLVRPSHPGNIGATARAMKTMGLASLWLVRPRMFPHPDAVARASGAVDVLDRVRVADSLESALESCGFAVATTSRRRELSHPLVTPRAAAQRLVAATGASDAALVFGNETTGLTNAELRICPLWTMISANPLYPSLNLAAAVQVLAYELRLAAFQEKVGKGTPAPASLADVERFFRDLESTLVEIGFLDPASPKRLMDRLRRLFARACLEREDLNVLRGILRSVRRS